MNNLDLAQSVDAETLRVSLFPVDLIPIDAAKKYEFAAKGVPYFTDELTYHPTIIARYALTCWNDYCRTQNTSDCEKFLSQVQWFV